MPDNDLANEIRECVTILTNQRAREGYLGMVTADIVIGPQLAFMQKYAALLDLHSPPFDELKHEATAWCSAVRLTVQITTGEGK